MGPHLQQNSEGLLPSGVLVSPLSLQEVERILTPASHWLRGSLYGRQPKRELSVSAIIDGAAQLLVKHEAVTRQIVSAGSALDGATLDWPAAVRVACDIITLTGWSHCMSDLRTVVSRVLTPQNWLASRVSNDVLTEPRALPEGIIRNLIRDSRILLALQFHDACSSGMVHESPASFAASAIVCNPMMQRAIVAHGSTITIRQLDALTDDAIATACFCEVMPATRKYHGDVDLCGIIADELSAFMPGFEEVR